MRLILLLLLYINLYACGYHFFIPLYEHRVYLNFLDNKVLGDEKDNPLYYSAYATEVAYDDRKRYYDRIQEKLNKKEWSSYLGISTDEVQKIIYEDKKPIMIKGEKKEEFKEYKKLLKVINRWGEGDWKKFLSIAKNSFKTSKSDFFKLRYAYQVARAYHILKKYKKEIEFIDSLDRNLQSKSIVWEWLDSFKAGAYQHLGDYVTSAYLFSKVFTTHKTDAYIGYYDFKIRSDQEWQELLKMAKNDEERIVFHFLRALNSKNNMLYELKKITKIDKNSIWTKRLKFMVANHVQYLIQSYQEDKQESEKRYIDDFMAYLKSQDDNYSKNIYKYFTYLQTKVCQKSDDKDWQEIFNFLCYVQNMKTLDEEAFAKRVEELQKKFPNKDIQRSILTVAMNKLKKLYPKNSLKRYMASSYDDNLVYFDGTDFRLGLELEDIQEYEKLANKKNKNIFERYFLKQFQLDKDSINVYKSVLLTRELKFKEAIKYAKLVKPHSKSGDIYDWDEKNRQRITRFNPFNSTFEGDNRSYKYFGKTYITHTKFLKTMIKIEDILKENPNSVTDNLLYATALFNITGFGNSPMFATIFRTPQVMDFDDEKLLKKSRKHFEKVLKLTKSKEIKAKTLYALLKVEFALGQLKYGKVEFEPYYGESGQVFDLISKDKEYQKLYHQLTKYKDTKYFQKVKGCATFKYFY
jgi:hypothetical protein